MLKALYILFRSSAVFGLGPLRHLRNSIYARHLSAHRINVDSQVRIQALHHNKGALINIGADLHVGYNSLIDLSGGLSIGKRVTISEGVKVFTHGHEIDGGTIDWRLNRVNFSHLNIEDDVWIGSGSIILPSASKLGAGSIIAAGSVVTQCVPPLAVVAGSPARIVRYRTLED